MTALINHTIRIVRACHCLIGGYNNGRAAASFLKDMEIDMAYSANGNDCRRGWSLLAAYVIGRLPADYMIGPNDLDWLDLCSSYLKGPPTNASVSQATQEALHAHPGFHFDPFELLIDAGICEPHWEPTP